MKNCLNILILTLFTLGINAQCHLTGSVHDSLNQRVLSGVNITNGSFNTGTITDLNGNFELWLDAGKHIIRFTMTGYESKSLSIEIKDQEEIDLGMILLTQAVIGLEEVKIIASESRDRKTPMAVSTFRAQTIERQLGDQPYPLIMKMSPGIYPVREGGGTGDASVNIRGFKQENVGLLLNGIPVNSVENGLVYWNNWTGLTEVTEQIQLQRGLGVSNVAQNSIGGTINIITKTTDTERRGSFQYEITSYGNSRATLMYSTGRLKNGLAISFQGARFSGSGYVDATEVNGWAYFLSISKEFNKDHKLVFTVLGNPETHGQRNFRLSEEEYKQYGCRYNKDWGSYNGQINNASVNFYHKPHFSLNYYWNISKKTFLASSAYFSFGSGGGKWTDTFAYNPWIFNYYNPSGQIDWDSIYAINLTNTDTFRLENGADTSGYSINIQTNFLADHIWAGALSTLHHEFNDNFKLIAGVHARYFKSKLQQKVRDLLGGEFYIDDYAWAIDGVSGREQIKNVGDIVKVDNGALVNYAGGFAQLEYQGASFSAFVSGTINNTWYQREDRYNYITDQKSEMISKTGYDFKLGLNYNINEYHNVYVNSGYFSRAPYFKFVFGNYTNTPTSGLENEKVGSIEMGYGLRYRKSSFSLNAYYTKWEDKSILSNEYNQFEDPSMIKGLDALHMGIEGEFSQGFSHWAQLGLIFSIGNWTWQNNVTALLYNSDNIVIDTVNVYCEGLYVGDAPQTQVGLRGNFRILRQFDLGINWIWYDRLYADFDPAKRTNPDDTDQSFRIPSYSSMDIHAGFPFEIGKLNCYANISCFNALNSQNIIRGVDGETHDITSFQGYWSFNRTFSFSLKMNF